MTDFLSTGIIEENIMNLYRHTNELYALVILMLLYQRQFNLLLAAYAVQRSKNWLAIFYHRIKARRGAVKAITATARKIAVIFIQ